MAEPTTAMPAGWEPAVPFDRCFDAGYGLEVVGAEDGVVRGRFPVRDALLDRHGRVHGGVFTAAAEALASRGTALAVMPQGNAAMGQSNDTTVTEDVREGEIAVEARLLLRSDDAWLWTVDARGADGRLCAHSRVTVAVRPFR